MLHYMYIITIGFSGWNAPPNGHDNGCKTVLDHGNTGMVKSRGRRPKNGGYLLSTCQHKHHHPEASVETSVTPQRIYNLYIGVSINGDPHFWMVY